MEVLNMGRDEENRKKWFKDNVFRYVLDLTPEQQADVIVTGQLNWTKKEETTQESVF